MRWMLIANACGARLLAVDTQGRLKLVREFEHARARLPTSRLARDRAGWTEGASHLGGAALVPPSDAHRRERVRFAAELADFLEGAARHGQFDELDLFAAPPFLGDLRGALGRAAGKRVHGVRPVDLTHVGWAELGRRTSQELATAAG